LNKYLEGNNGERYNWSPGTKYSGDDDFIKQAVLALDKMAENPSTANYNFKQINGDDVVTLEGNAILDYVNGGKYSDKTTYIKHADKNPEHRGENQHIMGTVYWDPARGMAEEGINGAKTTGAFPSMGILLHEMGHGVLFHLFGGEDWRDRTQYFPNEEQMIIDRLEKPAMLKLGFGYRTQHSPVYDSREEWFGSHQHRLDPRLPSILATYYIPSPSPISLKR
jgi:hypothetical protein